MANRVKENNTLYIRRCKHCKSLFSYTNLEWAKDDWHSDKGIIKCPYCERKNKIRLKIRYKSAKKMDKDYKAELEQVQKDNRLTNIKLKDLESEYSKFKCEVGKYTTYKKDYEEERKNV